MTDTDMTMAHQSVWAPTGTLTIDTVADHWGDLCPRLAEDVRADLSAVTRVDTAGVQLLIAARRVAREAGRHFHVHAATLPGGAAALLGITSDVVVVTTATTPAPRAGEKG
ncbi:hypothetical protein TBR22_A43240 [Luteitalea sp. TBR-22]|uniref:STAS domain-containing protein n=1 Tax=Luteitalea sp. TBR-22 TaxID=2802971 RepID=UPI001AF562AC|nr:STAS domain-containing protein [Luteitalea sp. TBR-22]BCS35098.1 hypothetical protein TBR22_A43240 [Luteitalea sp. TBR-22]